MKKKAPLLLGRLIISLSRNIWSKTLFGAKFGTLPTGQKSQPFSGSYVSQHEPSLSLENFVVQQLARLSTGTIK